MEAVDSNAVRNGYKAPAKTRRLTVKTKGKRELQFETVAKVLSAWMKTLKIGEDWKLQILSERPSNITLREKHVYQEYI